MASIQAVLDRDSLPGLHEPRCSIDRAIQDVRRDRDIAPGDYVAVTTLRELLDDLEAVGGQAR